MSSLAIVSPTRNPTHLYLQELARMASDQPGWQFVVIDDHSDLAVAEYLPARDNLCIHRNSTSLGAGACRNLGIELVERDYTLFLDDDDSMHWQVVASALTTMQSDRSIDVSFFLYDLLRDGVALAAMERDRSLLADALQGQATRVITLAGNERLLAFTNYPWNKIYRTSFLRRASIHFSQTAVQNDILGHWLTLLRAGNILLDERVLCTKVEYSAANRIGNIGDERCLEVFDALAQIYPLVRDHGKQAVQEVFLPYYLDLIQWRLSLAGGELRLPFWQRHIAFLKQMQAEDFLRTHEPAGLRWKLWDLPLLQEEMAGARSHDNQDASSRDGAILLMELSRLKRLSHELLNENARLQADHDRLVGELNELRTQVGELNELRAQNEAIRAEMLAQVGELSALRAQNEAIHAELHAFHTSTTGRCLRAFRRLVRGGA